MAVRAVWAGVASLSYAPAAVYSGARQECGRLLLGVLGALKAEAEFKAALATGVIEFLEHHHAKVELARLRR